MFNPDNAVYKLDEGFLDGSPSNRGGITIRHFAFCLISRKGVCPDVHHHRFWYSLSLLSCMCCVCICTDAQFWHGWMSLIPIDLV